MRSYPQASKKYRKTDALSTEWDLGLTLPEDYEDEVQAILQSITALDTVYALVGGVEFVMPKVGLKEFFQQSLKSGDTVGNYHVHVALIYKTLKTREQVLTDVGRLASPCRNYCVPRNTKYPYCTWKHHHVKPEGKVGAPILYERGQLPDDDINDPDICEMIIRIGTKYGAGAEVKMIKDHCALLEHSETNKRQRLDPSVSKNKAQARLDTYQERLDEAVTEEDKIKWAAYVFLVKRDHFPELLG